MHGYATRRNTLLQAPTIVKQSALRKVTLTQAGMQRARTIGMPSSCNEYTFWFTISPKLDGDVTYFFRDDRGVEWRFEAGMQAPEFVFAESSNH